MKMTMNDKQNVLVPVIKNDFQFIIGILFIGLFNYVLFRAFIYLYNKFEYLQAAFSGLLMLVASIGFVIAMIIEIAVLYESKQAVKIQINKEKD